MRRLRLHRRRRRAEERAGRDTRGHRARRVLSVTLSRARTLPARLAATPIVAELPVCQNTLQGRAPLITATAAASSVLAIWKTNRGSGCPWPSRTRLPVSPADEVKQ